MLHRFNMWRKVTAWTVIGAAGLSSPVLGFWPERHTSNSPAMVDRIELGRQINRAWPYPHVCPDRQWAVAPFDTMVSNGWRRQNLLGAHHFNEESNKLTPAGELKVHWTMTQTPPQFRQLYVERSLDPAVTEQRIATAREFAAQASMDGSEPVVRDTHIMSQGRPATAVVHEQKSFHENMIPAVLPTSSGDAAAATSN
jgi:hypothetical protein